MAESLGLGSSTELTLTGQDALAQVNDATAGSAPSDKATEDLGSLNSAAGIDPAAATVDEGEGDGDNVNGGFKVIIFNVPKVSTWLSG